MNREFQNIITGYEVAIRQQFKKEIQRLMSGSEEDQEFAWGVWCDQDEFMTCLENVVNDYEEIHHLMCDDYDEENDFGSAYLSALFDLEAVLACFEKKL